MKFDLYRDYGLTMRPSEFLTLGLYGIFTNKKYKKTDIAISTRYAVYRNLKLKEDEYLYRRGNRIEKDIDSLGDKLVIVVTR